MFASRIGRVSNFYVIVMMLLSVPLLTGVCLGSMGNGPSLLVYESEYAELRTRASQEPWATMKSRAITNSGYGYDVVGSPYYVIQSCLDSTALAYILDVPNQSTYKARIYDGIVNQLGALDVGDSYDWTGVVIGGTNVFSAINALDVVYDDLTTTQRTNCINVIQGKVNSVSTSGYWPLARTSLHGTWKIFNNTCTQDDCDAYYAEIIGDLTTDGVFRPGCTYAYSRHNRLDRNLKTLFMDVLEHTGEDNDNEYYDNPRIRAFQEWLYTATVSPSKRFITFGDSIPSETFLSYTPLYRAAKFGNTAAGYASDLVDYFDYPPRKDFFSYVIPDADELHIYNEKVMPASAPVSPSSKIYYQGGAWFREYHVSATEQSLMGALWTVTGIPGDEGHAHKESNAIYMAAYGEHVLLNSGYLIPYGSSWNGYSWNWFHNNAKSANTVVVNNGNHSSKAGGGLEEGFTHYYFDYACGNDGPALPDDTHLRSFIFVKPQDGKNGYFILFDEVDADPGETVNVLLHPNTKATTGITTVSDKREYRATINGLILDGNTDVKLSIFYGTTPTSVTKENGAIGNGSSPFETKYLNAKYNTDSNGNVQVATVLFPHNNTHAKPTMYRISGTALTGVYVSHGGAVDYVLASDGVTEVTYGCATFKAKSTVHRRLSWRNELAFFFARDSVKFLYTDGNNDVSGFEADSDITIHLDQLENVSGYGMWGNIRSDGTYVKFFYNNLDKVYLNGVLRTPTASGDDWVRVYVASGTHELMILPGWGTPEPATAAVLLVGALGILRRRKRKR